MKYSVDSSYIIFNNKYTYERYQVIHMKLMHILIIALLSISLFGCAQQGPRSVQGGKGQQLNEQQHTETHMDTFPYEDVSESEKEALDITLNDEYKARATYKKVIEKFGEVRPFSNIINAETSHADELIRLYEKYGLDIPDDDWYDKVPEFDSVEAACEAGVQAEIENADLYDEQFSKVDNQDIIAVFTALRDASRIKHLPAFERCGGGNG